MKYTVNIDRGMDVAGQHKHCGDMFESEPGAVINIHGSGHAKTCSEYVESGHLSPETADEKRPTRKNVTVSRGDES